jgi:signal transduction histidine kinase
LTRTPHASPEVTIDRCRALLAVPVIIQDRVYGALALYYSEPHAFAEEQIELASLFSTQVALAVENARLREQVQEAAVAAERNRLARDLHDSVTQALFSASLVAEVLPNMWRRDPVHAEQGLAELRLLTRGALAEMRTLLLELRPNTLVQTSLEELLWQLTEGLASRVQMEIKCTLEPVPDLPPDVQITFYRVAQEALNNVTKHAEASHALVSLRASPPLSTARSASWMGEIVLQVSDDGRGFDVNQTGPEQLGLRIMRERAESVGAALAIDSRPGHGTRVTLVWCSSENRLTANSGSYSTTRSEP